MSASDPKRTSACGAKSVANDPKHRFSPGCWRPIHLGHAGQRCAELCARLLFFQPVGNATAIEAILQTTVAFVVHDAVGHRDNEKKFIENASYFFLAMAAGAAPPALVAKAATSTIPIVFVSGDPIKEGLVASLNRPGGNATGVYNLVNELEAKQLGLLHELFPGATLFGVLLDAKFPPAVKLTP
jgi:hypothetical protein